MELLGWPEIYVFMAREYGFTPGEVNDLTLMQMCILLGAITPDHEIRRLPPADYRRLTRTQEQRSTLKRVHGR